MRGASMRGASRILVALLLAAATIGSWTAVVRVGQVAQDSNVQLGELRGALGGVVATSKAAHTKLNDQLGKLHGELRALVGEATAASEFPLTSVEELELRTAADAEAAIRKLGDMPTAHDMASCLNELDTWVMRPDDEQRAVGLKQELAARLRVQVIKDVRDKQRACLSAATGSDAIKLHGEAGQILALYPMSEDKGVIDEAKALSTQQVEIANRIDVLRRQRYNHWACKQIEAAIDGYNSGSSYTSPKKENKVLIDSLVGSLGEVDPGLIEPAVMELYNYVIDLTNGSISEKEKIELAKRLTDPSLRRKTLGDF